jgi:hypothetical protein
MSKHTPISDWDRLFAPNAPRRRGPIALFISMTLVLCFVTVLLVGANFGVKQYNKQAAALQLTATPLWKQYYIDQTATAQARAATAVPTVASERTAEVTTTANLRSEPRIAPETVLGQVGAGDSVTILEEQIGGDGTWYRVRLTKTSGQLALATEGWISSTLLKLP